MPTIEVEIEITCSAPVFIGSYWEPPEFCESPAVDYLGSEPYCEKHLNMARDQIKLEDEIERQFKHQDA